MNSTGRLASVRDAKVVIAVLDDLQPTDDISLLEQKVIQFHLWSDGIVGSGDSYESNPPGRKENGHTVVGLNLNQNLFATPLGLTGRQSDEQTFVISADLGAHNTQIAPGDEAVFIFLARDDGGSPIDFRTLHSN